jgi:hypothetical protein
MKIIRVFLKAAFYPSLLSLVMFLMAVAIFITSLMQVSVPFNSAQERTLVLNTLQDKVAYALASMQIQESYEVYALLYEREESGFIQYAETANASIDQEFSNLVAQGHIGSKFPYATDLTSKLQIFNDTRATHRKTFNEVVSSIKSGSADAALVMDQLEKDNQTLNAQLSDLIISVEQDRLAALQDFPENLNRGITFAVIGLAFCLILALLGYQVIATTVRPLRSLRNMITAIGGDRYRPEMQGALLKNRGPAGNLARALDQLARSEQERTAGIKKETERLRQELYESHRRRLRVFHPANTETEKE